MSADGSAIPRARMSVDSDLLQHLFMVKSWARHVLDELERPEFVDCTFPRAELAKEIVVVDELLEAMVQRSRDMLARLRAGAAS